MEKTTNETTNLSSFLCNHLIGLAIYYQQLSETEEPIGEVKFHCYSASIISIDGIWNLLTAGHVIKEIEEGLHSKKIKLQEVHLVDHLGSNSTSKEIFPFDYSNSPKIFFEDQRVGVDFGLIMLKQLYCELLSSNGVISLSEEHLYDDQTPIGNVYWILGIPNQTIREEKIAINHSAYKKKGIIAPVVISAKKIDDFYNKDGELSPFFVGKLSDEGYQIDDIKGMSGGPIFGFDEKMQRYWIIAIQSNWYPQQRIIFGTKISTIYSHFHGWVKDIEEKRVDNHSSSDE